MFREVLIQPEEKKKNCKSSCYSFWNRSGLRSRLNISGIIASVSDNLIDSISALSPSFSDYLSKNIPYYVTSLFYFLPTVLPFCAGSCKCLPNQKNPM